MNNAWIFNTTNRNLNNNNVNNANQVGAVTNLLKTLMTDEQFFSLLLRIMRKARRNKRYGKECAAFELDWASSLVSMLRALKEKTYRVDHNYAFLTSVPTWREIFATSFDGRIADLLLCLPLSPYIEKELHPRTFNNRKCMGAQAAINRVIDDIYEVSEGYTQPARIIKWDLKGFFPNAVCDIVERGFAGVIDKYQEDIASDYGPEMPGFLRWLAMVCIHCYPASHCELRTPRRLWKEHIPPEKSLFSKPPGKGTPIGRFASQEGMGLYMNDDVIWLNEECGIRSTLFMDDCVMVVPERLHSYALSLFPVLRQRFAAKGVRMNEKKFYDQPYQYGFEFLGSHIKSYRVHINNDTFGRATGRVREFNALANKYDYIDALVSSINSYTGLLKNRTDFKRLQDLCRSIAPQWWSMCEWDARRQCLVCRPGYTIRERLNMKYNLHLKRHGKLRNSRTNQCSGVAATCSPDGDGIERRSRRKVRETRTVVPDGVSRRVHGVQRRPRRVQ